MKEMIKVSKPEGIKDLWKNVKWNDEDEKLAFFNKYFVGSRMVRNIIDSAVDDFKDFIVDVIEMDKGLSVNDVKEKILSYKR